MGDITIIYFRGKTLCNIRKIVIESLGNPHWVSLCLIICNELIRNSAVFVLVNGCSREIMLSLFFNLIEDFSPSDSHGRRFLYFILTRVIGNYSSYIHLNSLRKFEKYDWQSVNETKADQFVFWIFSMNFSVFVSLIIRIVLYSLLIECSLHFFW